MWLSGLFSRFCLETDKAIMEGVGNLHMHNYPWEKEASENPVFCLLHWAMVLRSFVWTFPNGQAYHTYSIIGRDKGCRFVLALQRQNGQEDR
jgi:hypothetical protein